MWEFCTFSDIYLLHRWPFNSHKSSQCMLLNINVYIPVWFFFVYIPQIYTFLKKYLLRRKSRIALQKSGCRRKRRLTHNCSWEKYHISGGLLDTRKAEEKEIALHLLLQTQMHWSSCLKVGWYKLWPPLSG